MIKLIILDRDDTLNIDRGFTHKVEHLEIVKNAKELCRYIIQRGFLYGVATNQSGIGEGYYNRADMELFNKALFEKVGLQYQEENVAFCPHPRWIQPKCACRKPSPYLLLELCVRNDVPPSETIFIGDAATDAEAAQKAGCYFVAVDPLNGCEAVSRQIEVIDNGASCE